jgi:hypothetical protein
VSDYTKLSLHNITYRATFNCGSDVWIVNQKGLKIRDREIAFVEATRRFQSVGPSKEFWHQRQTGSYRRNGREITIPENWKTHLEEMESDRLLQVAFRYRPKARRNLKRQRTYVDNIEIKNIYIGMYVCFYILVYVLLWKYMHIYIRRIPIHINIPCLTRTSRSRNQDL